MKLIICSLGLALAASSADAALLGFWKQDEPVGDLIDSTGGHPPGTPTGILVYGQPGVSNGSYGAISVTAAIGTAIEYGPSNEDDFFLIDTDNNNPVMNLDTTGAFTVMGWVNPSQNDAARTYRFLSTGSAAGGDRGWGIGLRLPNTAGTGSTLRFTNYGVLDNDSSAFDVVFGAWIHLAATYNNGLISYFLNGNALDSDVSSFGNELAPARLIVGARLGGNDVDQMNGLIDGVQVHDQILTVEEIRAAAINSVSIPEPSSAILGLLGGLALLRRRR